MLVIGGGPAGLSAAAEAARRGLRVTLIEEGTHLGGQYFRGRMTATNEGSPRWFWSRTSSVDVRTSTAVVDIREGGAVTTWHPERRLERVPYDWLILATGAFDRPVPVPGWTLPGVMTAGGAHSLAKAHGVAAGRRVLVAGSGPFLLSVADVLSGIGCRVTTLEATPFRAQLRALPQLLADPPLLRQAAGFMTRLTFRGARPRYGRIVTRILGQDRVEGAVTSRVDADWAPIRGTEEKLEVEGVCLGYGFVPRLDLAELLGLAMEYLADSSDYRLAVDDQQTTSVPNILAAGEITGVAGARAAANEGLLAGLTVAFKAGAADVDTYVGGRDRLKRRLRTLGRSAEWLRLAYRPRASVWELPDESTMVCRCESVRLGSIEAAAEVAGSSPRAVKSATRLGMGMCQGRVCSPFLIEWLRASRGYEPSELERPWRVRPPVVPVPLDDMAALWPD